MSNAVVSYGYDGLGRKITQTSSARGTDGLKQNLLFSYNKACLLARIEDRTSRQVTTYEYDLAGNRVHEKTVIVETKPATAAVILPTDPDAVVITELYEVLLGRHPDPAGLEYWRGRYNGIRGELLGSINTIPKLAETMLNSDEARETFKSDGSVEQFVDKLFSVAVGRQPSAAQRASYISQFDNGYLFDAPNRAGNSRFDHTAHGDLYTHEIRLVRDRVFVHEFAFERGGTLLVEFTGFSHREEMLRRES